MRQRVVLFSPEAREDLLRLYDYIAQVVGSKTAFGYIQRIEAFCLHLETASERGQRRDDIRQGLRVVGFERRITITFSVDIERVTILRFYTGGQNWEQSGN